MGYESGHVGYTLGTFRIYPGSLGAKSCNVSLRLTQKVAKVWVVIMTGKYPWNIIRVGVELYCGCKVPEIRDVQGYPRA